MKIHIANLSYDITPDALRHAFEAHGSVTDVSIPTDRLTGRPRGFGFVTFSTEEAGKSAMDAMNSRELGGRAIKVTEARPAGETGAAPSNASVPKKNFGPDRKPGAFAARYRNRR